MLSKSLDGFPTGNFLLPSPAYDRTVIKQVNLSFKFANTQSRQSDDSV
jgi:hypothetical protein